MKYLTRISFGIGIMKIMFRLIGREATLLSMALAAEQLSKHELSFYQDPEY